MARLRKYGAPLISPITPIFDERTKRGAIQVGNSPALITYPEAVLADLPAYYLRLQETSGTVALDQGSSAVNGTYVGSPLLAQSGPFPGSVAPLFDGVDDEVTRTSTPAPGRPVTIECCLKALRSANPGAIACLSTRVLAGGYALDTSVNGALVLTFYSVGTVTSGNDVVPDDTWTHLAATVTSIGTVTLYVNGQVVGGGSLGAPNASAAAIRIGALYGSGGAGTNARLAGQICEMAYYQSALSAARILAHYTAGFGS